METEVVDAAPLGKRDGQAERIVPNGDRRARIGDLIVELIVWLPHSQIPDGPAVRLPYMSREILLWNLI